MSLPLLIAHRGASREAPENTLEAFRLAWKQGADAIETDLRLTADREIVAFHDTNGRRTLGMRRRIRDLPLSDLRPHVPTLAEVLATVPAGKTVVLELKEPLVAELRRALAAASLDRIVLIAFDPAIIAEAKLALPGCRALLLFSNYGFAIRDRGKRLARLISELGLDGVDLRYERRLDARLLAPLREDARIVFTYTVNSARGIDRCVRLGIDGITTDRPTCARRWLLDRI